MMKTMIGLGVLSVPATFDTLGLIPGVICLCTVAAITTWSDYMIGVFKLRHRQVYGIEDVGQLLFGRAGKYFFSCAFIFCKHALIPASGQVPLPAYSTCLHVCCV